MGHFGKVAGAQVFGGGAYFCLGQHKVKIVKTKIVSGQNGVSAIIECSILDTNAAQVETDPTKVIKKGMTVAQVIPDYGKAKPLFAQNVKRFVLAACGIEPESQDEEEARACRFMEKLLEQKPGSMNFEDVCDRIFDEKTNLFEGLVMNVEGVRRTTKAGEKIAVPHWRPADWTEEGQAA